MQYLGTISEMTEWSLFVSKASHSISQWFKSVPQPLCWRSWSRTILWRPTRPSRTNSQRRYPFHHRGLECNSRKIPGVTGKFGLGVQNEAGKGITEFCEENALVIANTHFQQDKTLHIDITRWSIPKSDYFLCSQRWRNSIQSANTRPGAYCGSDHELLIAKFRLKLKNVRKTLRPLQYDLN